MPSESFAAESEREQEYRFIVPHGSLAVRLDRFLAGCLEEDGLSRERIKEHILAGRASVNGRPCAVPRFALREGDEVRLRIFRPASNLIPEAGDIAVLYRDNVLAVLNKPAGLAVHPAPGLEKGTLVHRLLAHFPELAAQPGFRPGIAHRLDKDTSGLMLVALTEECRLALAAMFARREVYKEYLALCHGAVEKSPMLIDAPMGRDASNKTRMAVVPGGKEAKSEARLLFAGALKRFSLAAVRIFTGRTHQVRVHMRHIGHPLWGDKAYGLPAKEKEARVLGCALPERQMLHAWKLRFPHPLPGKAGKARIGSAVHNGGELSFVCPPPGDFAEAARCLSQRCLRVVITGSPGCGKSTLATLLRDKGFPVFNADACVAALYAPGGDGRALLRRRFDSRFVPDNERAPVDKAALAKAMGSDDALRREVESLIHPLVRHAVDQFWQACDHAGKKLAFAEIPLYLESGQRAADAARLEETPLLVGVDCPFAIRAQRLETKRGWNADTIARMESWQWPDDKKMRACDMVIENSRGPDELLAESCGLLEKLECEIIRRLDEIMLTLDALWSK